jgi:hypothetical protein
MQTADQRFSRSKLGGTAAEDLLEVFVRRHETASTLITTNRPTQDWGQFLGDVPAATAILDRFLAHAEIVPMSGKSYRLRTALPHLYSWKLAAERCQHLVYESPSPIHHSLAPAHSHDRGVADP